MWKSKKKPTVALSSCEAEYVALTFCIQEAKFLKQLLSDLEFKNVQIDVGVDNQGALLLARNPVFHERSKHIDIKYHFIREEIQKGNVNLFYVHTTNNWSDIFTKPVTPNKLISFSYVY